MPARAFFGPPILAPVAGGLHIGAAVIPVKRGQLWMLFRRIGIFGGPNEAWYFPTDYFLFSESIEDCIRRVTREQSGFKVRSFVVADAWSFLPGPASDWHLGISCVAEVSGRASPGEGVEEVRAFRLADLPKNLAWWTPPQLRRIFKAALLRKLKVA